MIYHLLALVSLLSPTPRGVVRLAGGLAYGPLARQKLDIYAPTGAGGALPVLVFFYGGSWMLGARYYFAFVARALAAAGYVVVVGDYRLVPRAEYPAFLEDSTAIVDWTLGHIGAHGGDPSRVAVLGHSAGAYNGVMSVLRLADPARVRAVASLSGPFDFYPFDVPASLRVFGAVDNPRLTQPVNLVKPGLPPLLLCHGEADELVQPRNSTALAAAWTGAGNVATLKLYPGVDHGGTLLQCGAWGKQGPACRDLVDFLRQHV